MYKRYGDGVSGSSLTRRHPGALRLAAYSPVELVVVVMCLPPEVEPDQQQTEGEEEDERPQQLPLHKHKHTQIQLLCFLIDQRNMILIPFDDTKNTFTAPQQSDSCRAALNININKT